MADPVAARPRVLGAVVLLLAAANLYGLWIGLTHEAELVERFPRLDRLWTFYLACPVVSLAALGAVWAWRRWGLFLALGVAAAVFAIELYASGPAPHVFRVPVASAVLVAAVWPNWPRFH